MAKDNNKFDLSAIVNANGDGINPDDVERTFYDFHYCPFWTATSWEDNMSPKIQSMVLLTHVFGTIAEVHNAFVK